MALQARRTQLTLQVDQAKQGIDLLKQEGETIQEKDVMMQRQVSLLQDQLAAVDGLLKRGVATVNQKLSIEQSLAQFESSDLDLKLAGLKSRQEWLKAQQSVIEIANQLRAQDVAELSQTDARIAELSKRGIEAANAPKPAGACAQAPGPMFEVVAGKDGAMKVMPVAPLAGAGGA